MENANASKGKPKTHLKKVETRTSPPIFDGKGYTGDWLADQVFPDLQWAVEGIIPEGLTLLVGAPKAGKSWFSLGIALSVAQGQPALGSIPTKARPVLLLALEDSQRRMQQRCRSILGSNSIPQNLNVYHRVDETRWVSDMKKWVYDNFTPAAPPVVILDTLGKVMTTNSNDNAYARDYKLGSAIKSVADDYPGTSVLVVHHTRKAEVTDFIDSISGTQGLGGSADSILILSRPRNEDEGVIKVTGRDVEENEYAIVKADNGNWQLADADLRKSAQHARATNNNLGANMQKLLTHIVCEGEVLTADLTPIFGQNTYQWLKRLEADRKIIKLGRGKYASADIPFSSDGSGAS